MTKNVLELFGSPCPGARKKKALKSDENVFSGQKKKIEKKKALKSDQNVFSGKKKKKSKKKKH